jgi:hypothetical protein
MHTKIVGFWDVTQCNLVRIYQSFEATTCLHLNSLEMKGQVPSKRWYPPTELRGFCIPQDLHSRRVSQTSNIMFVQSTPTIS